uniref:Neuroparsin n=1 Tax=Rhodnius prolixus TaxID=13249 RepID=T1I194_RHOPR
MTTSLVAVLMATVLFELAHSCTPCFGENCNDNLPRYCVYGNYTNSCGRLECKKGPGERCRGYWLMERQRSCADGTSCKCGLCAGCTGWIALNDIKLQLNNLVLGCKALGCLSKKKYFYI